MTYLGSIMQNLIYNFIRFILEWQGKLHKKQLKNYTQAFQNGSSKVTFYGDSELVLNAETELKKLELDEKVKKIVKEKLNNPEALLSFINDSGTDVFRIDNANFLLKLIGEEEGFITPAKGFKAVFINLVVNYLVYKNIVISAKSNEMFILRPLPVDIYYMIHQFHKWYSFKIGLPGFKDKEQQNFKKIFKTLKQEDISKLSLGEIIALKEAIARDVEAIDFVVNLSKEYDASKKLLKKLKSGASINL